ncbi:MAG TPA: PD-(D/E)XK nuclease family protein [Candidatus Kapabacteria bacterium]|nr:PD-(D/E)XK nuclease family protein [Candidatus Kapabacteria bacterium]
MPMDKYTAVWTSHTSISDFLHCPRAYYLKHVYKDPKTRHKIKLMGPALALGQSVHEVLESLSVLPTDKRFLDPLLARFDRAWDKVAGKKGGFLDIDTEYRYKERGKAMLRRVEAHPGPIARQAIKIKQDLPYFWISEEDNIILCGKVDWLEYLADIDSVHIIDFKTGKKEEEADSLQLPIYHLLVHHCQKRKVVKASYWYLETSDTLTEKTLPSLLDAQNAVLQIGRQMKLARQLERFKCPEGGECRHCLPLERVIRGDAEFVGTDEFNYDVYIPKQAVQAIDLAPMEESVIL